MLQETIETQETCSGNVQSSIHFCYQFPLKNGGFVSERDLSMSKSINFITDLTTIHWVKPTWAAEAMFSTSTLLIGDPTGDAGRGE